VDAPCTFIDNTTYNDIFAHAHVKRYHTENTRDQRIAEHCYRVTLLAVKLFYAHERVSKKVAAPGTELAIFRYGMIHEASELDYGDVPAHVKAIMRDRYQVDWNKIAEQEHWQARGVTIVPEPAPLVKALVSLADTIEGMIVALTIPNGPTRHAVLESWDQIFSKRLLGFLQRDVFEEPFGEFVNGLYETRLNHLDPAWR
jgi:hypothetical protein